MSLPGRKVWLSHVLLMLFFSIHAEAVERVPPVFVSFCAPQNNIYPFFVTENERLSGINPQILRQMFASPDLADAALRFVKRPWKRCNADLESGSVDMMIGGYDPKRVSVSYPSSLGFDLQSSMVSTANVCFFSLPGEQMRRAQAGLVGTAPFMVGIAAGFSKLHDEKIRPQWIELFNPIEMYRMLEKGRVDAIVQVCAMDGDYPLKTMADIRGYQGFEPLFPPYLANPAYVVFSNQFATEHAELARRIVSASLHVDKQQAYREYLADN